MTRSSSSSTIEYKNEKDVVCNCNHLANIIKAWTDDNPRRSWYDVEKPHGWQRDVLIGARDVMRQQKKEIMSLINKVRALTVDGESVEKKKRSTMYVKQACEECEALKKEVLVLKKRSTVYHNVLITPSIGFTIVIGVIVGMLKW
ncbi:hypothetical protein N665_0352s0039 [Sinapis alba]|nr:hypothetical protein N665_0352s0039 [Sinapis alba]